MLPVPDAPGMAVVGGISSIANTFDVASVPAAVACPWLILYVYCFAGVPSIAITVAVILP